MGKKNWNALRDVLGVGKEPTLEEIELKNILAGEVSGEVSVGRTGFTDGFVIYDLNEEDIENA